MTEKRDYWWEVWLKCCLLNIYIELQCFMIKARISSQHWTVSYQKFQTKPWEQVSFMKIEPRFHDWYCSGSSKQGDTVVKFEESDDDSWARDDKQAKKDDKTKKEEKKESVFGKVFSKNKPAPAPTLPSRKIVGERWVTKKIWKL